HIGAGDCDSGTGANRQLASVNATLKDADGNVVGTTLTDQNGDYAFENLFPGTYTIVEHTPPGLIDDDEHIGTINGIAVGIISADDTVSSITIGGGQNAIDYDFCELLPASI